MEADDLAKSELAVAEKIIESPVGWGEKFLHLVFLDPNRTEVLVMWLFLAVLLIGMVLLMRAWDRDSNNDIVISDLICIDGRISESKLARFVAFAISSWAFVFLIITEKMTEWFFFGYMAAWVSNAIFSKYIDKKMPDSSNNDLHQDTAHNEPDEPGSPETNIRPARAHRRRKQ